MRAAEVIPVALRVVRVEPHRFPDPFDAVLGSPQPREQLAVLNQDEVVVGIEAQRALLMIASLVVLIVRQVYGGEDAVNVAVVVIERESDRELIGHVFPGAFTILAPVIDPGLTQNASLPRMRVGV